MKNIYLILSVILFLHISSFAQTGTFNFDKKTTDSTPDSVVQLIGSIKLKVTATSLLSLDSNGSSTGDRVYGGDPTNSMTLEFTKNGKPAYVNIATIFAFEHGEEVIPTDYYTFFFSINGGNLIPKTVVANGTPVDLSTGDVNSIVITCESPIQFGIDDVTMNAAVPVELTSFTATKMTNGVMLNWQTATEVNNYGFEVQRSEGRDQKSEWKEIGFVEGHGNSNSPKEYSFVDKSPIGGNILYRLKQIDTDGTFEYSDTVEVKIEIDKIELYQNHPNPFNPSTVISFSLPEFSHVNLSIYNAIGQKVAMLLNQQLDAGYHSIDFDASALSTGFYFYRIETHNYSRTMKMMLVK
ncbi:MAG: T9SS type A sorting domain-containing protein [Bacteroidota bacterium]